MRLDETGIDSKELKARKILYRPKERKLSFRRTLRIFGAILEEGTRVVNDHLDCQTVLELFALKSLINRLSKALSTSQFRHWLQTSSSKTERIRKKIRLFNDGSTFSVQTRNTSFPY